MAIRKSSISGGSGSNGFSLLVGSSGNTTFTFDSDQPAGAYSVTSQIGDATFDIYLVTSDNENAGYSSTGALEATLAFDRVVIYGGTENDIFNFTYSASNSPTSKGDVIDGVAPFLTSATPTTLDTIDDTTTVTGGNFAADVTISFTGQDSAVVAAKSVVRSSSTELIVTRPDAFPVAQEPFSMTATNAGITNPSVTVNKLTNYFDAGSGVVWVTSSPLPQYITDTAYSTTLEATDADGGAVTYSVTTGSLPTGLSLNSATGVISGTPTGSADETFTVTATDAGGNSSPREFLLPNLPLEVDFLVIAGGGGGGRAAGAGGGAGGYRTSAGTSGGGASAESVLTPGLSTDLTITIGAGGAGQVSGSITPNGNSSTFASITSDGGGGGGGYNATNTPSGTTNGRNGGSGGGRWGTGTVGTGTANQGYNGGTGTGGPAYGETSGGGGGSGAVGQSGSYGAYNGAGGNGVSSSITGTAITRAGGGGAGSGSTGITAGGAAGSGGAGAGGNSVSGQLDGGNATINTGSGGGGGSYTGMLSNLGLAGSGASGIVILKYPDAYTATFSGGVTHDTPDPSPVSGYKITTITATSTTSETVSFA